MPKIAVGEPTSNSGSGGMDEIRNPLSVWRNTVRVRPNEYAVVRFIGEGGDLSRYHNIPGTTASGARFTKYEYCTRANKQRVPGSDYSVCHSVDALSFLEDGCYRLVSECDNNFDFFRFTWLAEYSNWSDYFSYCRNCTGNWC